MGRLLFYILIILFVFMGLRYLLRLMIRLQEAKSKNVKKVNKSTFDPDNIQDADYEEIKKE